MSKTTKATKATKTHTQYVYAYVFNGGVLKQNHCVVSVSTDHPETTIFNELKRYYGNDIKGAFYKCSKTLEEVQAGIDFKLKKHCLGEILFNHNFTETKKLLLEITGLKQCSGTINTFKKDGDAEDEDTTQKVAAKTETEEPDDVAESDAEDSESDEKNKKSKGKSKTDTKKSSGKKEAVKEETKKKADTKKADTKKTETKKTDTKKADTKKVEVSEDESEDEDEAEDSEPETKKKSKSKTDKAKGKESTKKTSSKKTEVESDSDVEVQPKKNNTSIELSDESDEEDEN